MKPITQDTLRGMPFDVADSYVKDKFMDAPPGAVVYIDTEALVPDWYDRLRARMTNAD